MSIPVVLWRQLVDTDSVRARVTKQLFVPKEFSAKDFADALQECLNKKSRSQNKIRGKPYLKLVLLVITNEALLNFSFCKNVLDFYRFKKPEPWDFAFFILPPSIPHRPSAELKLNYRAIQIQFDS